MPNSVCGAVGQVLFFTVLVRRQNLHIKLNTPWSFMVFTKHVGVLILKGDSCWNCVLKRVQRISTHCRQYIRFVYR